MKNLIKKLFTYLSEENRRDLARSLKTTEFNFLHENGFFKDEDLLPNDFISFFSYDSFKTYYDIVKSDNRNENENGEEIQTHRMINCFRCGKPIFDCCDNTGNLALTYMTEEGGRSCCPHCYNSLDHDSFYSKDAIISPVEDEC